MDLKATEKKIRETEAAIRRDLSEISKVDGTIRRSQERKKVLENRVKDNRTLLSDLENRKTVLIIEAKIGRMDEGKLARLTELIADHEDAFEKEAPALEEDRDETETDHASPVSTRV